MAKCDICSKQTIFGHNVSHSVRRTKRNWRPNVRRVRVIVNGASKTMNVCTSCLRSNKVTRAL